MFEKSSQAVFLCYYLGEQLLSKQDSFVTSCKEFITIKLGLIGEYSGEPDLPERHYFRFQIRDKIQQSPGWDKNKFKTKGEGLFNIFQSLQALLQCLQFNARYFYVDSSTLSNGRPIHQANLASCLRQPIGEGVNFFLYTSPSFSPTLSSFISILCFLLLHPLLPLSI